LVDSWRAIGVRRNDLRSGLDIVFAGDISNKNSSAFDLRDSTGRLKVGVQFDAPLTRLIERNDYRKALIEYQQARRDHYQAEDMITRDLRSILRNIDLNELNFEIQRAAIHVAIAQVELARLKLQEPPKPNQTNSFGATTARDLVTALSSLLDAQNQFVNIWVNYESLRRSLDLDMGTMQLDPEGMWVEQGKFEYGSSNEQPPVDPLMKPLVSEVVPDMATEPAVVGPPRPVTEAAEIVPQMVELVQPVVQQ
jgi:hypothetical protein